MTPLLDAQTDSEILILIGSDHREGIDIEHVTLVMKLIRCTGAIVSNGYA
jgi:hypothetical protein